MSFSSPYTGFSSKATPQTQPIPFREADMVKSASGGYTFKLDDFKALERFVVLGSAGGTYYVSEQALTRENAKSVVAAIQADGARAIEIIVGVSKAGRAPKNDPAIFALALAASSPDRETRSRALAALPQVCRIPTHLFHFVTYVKQFRGMGRGLKRAIANWYQEMEPGKLAYETVKYQSRDGWSNRDLLRLTHPKTSDPVRNAVYKWITGGFEETTKRHDPAQVPDIIKAFEHAKVADSVDLPDLIKLHNLSREMLPTEALTRPEVWDAMLPKMGLTALLRNLGNMSKVGLLKPLSDAQSLVVSRLTDREELKRARVHPFAILLAAQTYGQGHGVRGKGEWTASSQVVDALNAAFYLAFDYVEPTNKRFLLGVDVSGSMSDTIAGFPDLNAAQGAALMALATVKVEPNYEIITFSTEFQHKCKLSKSMSLEQVTKEIRGSGGTDCSVPIQWALDNKVVADAIVILTDNESWAGKRHAVQALKEYRERINPKVKIINVGMTATRSTVNDPNDLNALNVVGFDSSVPSVINDFVRS